MPTRSTAPRSDLGGSSSSASISSSEASLSFCPSPSKNLTPLYCGGLCEAEMTAPRSSASRATAGVGRMPPSTAFPPADATPSANAASSSGPELRVSRPTKTRPRPDQSAAARPRRSTRSVVSSSPTTPRTPSVPKYRRAMRGSLGREARVGADRREVLFLLSILRELGLQRYRALQVLERRFRGAVQRFAAGEVVQQARVVGMLTQTVF